MTFGFNFILGYDYTQFARIEPAGYRKWPAVQAEFQTALTQHVFGAAPKFC